MRIIREKANLADAKVVQNRGWQAEVSVISHQPQGMICLDRIKPFILKALGYPFNLTFVQSRQRLPQGKTGKFEEFMSLIPRSA